MSKISQNSEAENTPPFDLIYDAGAYISRAMMWLDKCQQTPRFNTLLYACIEARMGIEYLLFEQLVISTGAKLSREDYERCLKDRMSFEKMIRQLSPELSKVQDFTRLVLSVYGDFHVNYWTPRELVVSWGKLSTYLHWRGMRLETTENAAWLQVGLREVVKLVEPIWRRLSSGPSGILHPSNMTPAVYAIWSEFRDGQADAQETRTKLDEVQDLSNMRGKTLEKQKQEDS